MIKDFEFFHRAVFARILHSSQQVVSLSAFPSPSNASYVVNETFGIYIKYSTKRMTPWRFTFRKEHKEEIDLMKRLFNEVFLILVCNDDGLVCLDYSELMDILENQRDRMEWISASRHKREMYTVKGPNGQLDLKVGQKDFLEKLFRRYRKALA